MTRLNRPSLPFIGLLVALGTASIFGCSFDTHGEPPDDTTGGKGGMGGAGGEGGMAGFGGGMVCPPGTTMPCYSGPVKTTNVGICKIGSQTCKADGSGYDVCVGEVLPEAQENCVVVGDEDCNGLADLQDDKVCVCDTKGTSVACPTNMMGVCANGTGSCSDDGRSVTDCMPITGPTPENCATTEDDDCDGITAPACTGAPISTFTAAGATGDDAIFSVAYTPDGGYVIGGVIDGTVGADGYGVTAGTAYIAKYDATKTLKWEKKFDGATFGVVRGLAVDKDGNIIATGSYNGSMTVDMGVTLISDAVDLFLIKLDPTGTFLWAKPLQNVKTQNAFGVAVDAAANIFIIGSTDNDVDLGGGNRMVTGTDFFMASYTPDNTHRWSKVYASAGNQFGRAIATTSNGDVVIIGDTDNSDINLGGSPLPKTNGGDFFVARYTNDTGAHAWSQRFGSTMEQFGRGIAVGPDGNVLITGGFTGTLDWKAGTSMTCVGTADLYVAKLDGTTGNYMMHAKGAKSGTSVGSSVGIDASGNVTVFGHFNGSIDFGGQSVSSSPSSYDTFLVKLKATDWTPVWTKTFGKAGHQYGWDVAVAPDGTTLVGGGFNQEFEVPPNAIIPSTGGMDLYGVLSSP